jgi:flagellar basal body-associated protein FliL
MDQLENTPEKGTKRIKQVVAVIVILLAVAAAAYGYYLLGKDTGSANTNSEANTNTSSNANANVSANTNVVANQNTNSGSTNTNTSANTNTSTNTNTSVDTSHWKEYVSQLYDFTVMYPSDATVTSDSLYMPLITTGIDKCQFGFNGEGLGRGAPSTRIEDATIVVDGMTLTEKRWTYSETNRLNLGVIQLPNSASMIELSYPDSQANDDCQVLLSGILNTYHSK